MDTIKYIYKINRYYNILASASSNSFTVFGMLLSATVSPLNFPGIVLNIDEYLLVVKANGKLG